MSLYADEELRTIGYVEEVTPAFVQISVRREAPHGTAISTGTFQQFPRLNGLVTIPSEGGSILAMITWVGVDESSQRPSASDSLSLPTPERVIRVIPIGRLHYDHATSSYSLDRGVATFPTVGDAVRLPTSDEARSAIPHGPDRTARIVLGAAAVDGTTPVSVDPNRFFGRHLAILGNTGSGKSCTLTHILREAAKTSSADGAFRAIIFDLNGEFGNAFSDLPPHVAVHHLSVDPGETQNQLRVPFWLWTYREWSALLQASSRSQAPLLRQALGLLREHRVANQGDGVVYYVTSRRILHEFRLQRVSDSQCPAHLSGLLTAYQSLDSLDSEKTNSNLQAYLEDVRSVLGLRWDKAKETWKFGARGLTLPECTRLLAQLEDAFAEYEVPITLPGSDADTPVEFHEADLAGLLDVLAVSAGGDTPTWVSPMIDRLQTHLSDSRLVRLCGHVESEGLGDVLAQFLGDRGSQITRLDLSLVPSSAQHVVAAVIARLVLSANERARRLGFRIPTLIAIEEAHSLVLRVHSGAEHPDSPMTEICREAFERIAREGRKYGVSLVVSSQRPSELSETVLAQCNTYLVHRIVNHRDQEIIARLIPDALGGLLSELPSYPARMALLVGAASEIPVLLIVEELQRDYVPDAANPDYLLAWRAPSISGIAALAESWAPSIAAPEGLVTAAEDPPPY